MAHGTCKYEGCGTTGRIHLGWCVGHYTRWKRTGDLGGPTVAPVRVVIPKGSICSVATCDEPMHCRTWCRGHYSRWEKTGDIREHIPVQRGPRVRKPKPQPKVKPAPRLCVADDCDEPHYIGGYCIAHDYRVKRYGDPNGGSYRFSDIVRRTRHLPLVERFWARVDKDGPVNPDRPELGQCWIWLASLNGNGYGQAFGFDVGTLAHRIAWFLTGRPLITGLELDHLCRTPACLRPDHLEQVTGLVNKLRGNGWSGRNARKTHCSQGHPFDAVNTLVGANGHRRCRICTNTYFRTLAERRGLDAFDLEISAAYRLAIAGDPCRFCGGPATQVEHYYPVSKGGNDNWLNLGRACAPCNRVKSARCGTWFILQRGIKAAA